MQQRGEDIDGEMADDYSGSSVISADGSVVAIGAIGNDGMEIIVAMFGFIKTTMGLGSK